MHLSHRHTSIINWCKKECVLIIALLCAVVSCFFSVPSMSYIDFEVLILLLNLMLIVAAFKELKILDFLAISIIKRCTTSRSLFLALIGITFFSAMLVTNDVALITFVPLALIIAEKISINILSLVVLQTLAANLGSSLTPMGNPQNLFIYSFYNLDTAAFFKVTLPLVLFAIILLSLFILKEKNEKLTLIIEPITLDQPVQIGIFICLFLLVLLSVFHVFPYVLVAVIVWLTVLVCHKQLFMKVDYSLLITFIAFFIFIGNLSHMAVIKSFMESILHTGQNTFWASLLSSQVISNVPATILIANFTPHYKELLLGVNLGGMGTLIASLASVISYKLYAKEYPTKTYLKTFSLYNLLGLIVLVPIIYWLFVR